MKTHLAKLVTLLTFVLVSSANTSSAALPKNSVYLEGFGNGILYSLNYERVFADDFGARLGYGAISMSGIDSDGTITDVFMNFIPISFNYLGLRSETDRHIFELGAGATVVVVSGTVSSIIDVSGTGATAWINATAGYRFQGDSFQFRIGLNPLFNPQDDGDSETSPFTALPYISFGGAF